MESNQIFTFGYGNRKNYDQILEYIKFFKIKYVIDIRRHPRAWSRLWYGNKLSTLCQLNSIKYVSKTNLGNTSGNQKWIPENQEAADRELNEVAEIVKEANVLLLCAEKDSMRCHRTEVAICVSKLTGVPVKHLS